MLQRIRKTYVQDPVFLDFLGIAGVGLCYVSVYTGIQKFSLLLVLFFSLLLVSVSVKALIGPNSATTSIHRQCVQPIGTSWAPLCVFLVQNSPAASSSVPFGPVQPQCVQGPERQWRVHPFDGIYRGSLSPNDAGYTGLPG